METALIPPGPLIALDYLGIAVFALSGALVAAEKRQTLVTFIFFAVLTGVGGGTVRDLLIGAPVFWMRHNETLLVCVAAGLLVWFFHGAKKTQKWIDWFDALGLAAYAVYGASKALRYDIAPLPALAPRFLPKNELATVLGSSSELGRPRRPGGPRPEKARRLTQIQR